MNRSIRPVFLGIAGLLCLPAAARAESFHYKYRPGMVVRNHAALAGAMIVGQPGGRMAKMRFRVSLKQTQRVVSVGNGIVTLEITDLPTAANMVSQGQTRAYLKTPTKSVVRMTTRGKFLSRKSVTGDAGGSPGMEAADALYGLSFPDRDVKPGDAWEETVTVGGKGSPQQVTVNCKYLGNQVFRGRNCARFYSTLSMPMSMGGGEDASEDASPSLQGKTTGAVTTYFDPKAGMEVYSTGSLTVLAKADLSRISPEAGQFATVSKINMIQSLVSAATR